MTRDAAGRLTRSTLFHMVSMVIAIAFLFPLLWALLNSFKTKSE